MTKFIPYYINLRGCSDSLFHKLTGWDRHTAQKVMMAQKFTVMPERPMMPDAKMSGETGPYGKITRKIWTENFIKPVREQKGWKSSATDVVAAGEI